MFLRFRDTSVSRLLHKGETIPKSSTLIYPPTLIAKLLGEEQTLNKMNTRQCCKKSYLKIRSGNSISDQNIKQNEYSAVGGLTRGWTVGDQYYCRGNWVQTVGGVH